MSSLDDFISAKRQRDSMAAMRWTASLPALRLFFPDDGYRTREYSISDDDASILNSACAVVEHEFNSEISYCASYELGAAVQKVVLRFLDKKLKRLAIAAKQESDSLTEALTQT